MKRQVWKTLRNRAGFTLVELIVVIAILGILAGVGTVTYSGYIKRANKAVDQQLVADTEYAVALAGVSNNLGSRAGQGLLGYIILSDTDNVVAKDTLTTNDGSETTYLDEAMKTAFGEDYAATLRLKYSGWADAATMLNEVANNPYAVSVNSSSYINNVGTEKLLGDVQGCTTALAAFMDDLNGGDAAAAYNSLQWFMGDTLDQIYADAGMESADSTGETLANATVICISDYVNSNQEAVAKSFYDVSGGSFDNLILNNSLEDFASGSNRKNLLYNTATWYAAGEAMVAYLDDPECTEMFQTIDMSGDAGTILENMQNAYIGITSRTQDAVNNPELYQKFMNYYTTPVSDGKTQAQLDGESYVAIMSTVNNLSGDYKNAADLGSANLFSNAGMVNRIDSYVAAASLSDYLGEGSPLAEVISNTDGAAVVIIVTADENGNVGCIPCPTDAAF